MKINLWSHSRTAFSYTVLSDCTSSMVLIDPRGSEQPYLDYIQEHGAVVKAIIITQAGSADMPLIESIQILLGAELVLPEKIDTGDSPQLTLGKITLNLYPSNVVGERTLKILMEHRGKPYAMFSGIREDNEQQLKGIDVIWYPLSRTDPEE